jgi:hypothetical protein
VWFPNLFFFFSISTWVLIFLNHTCFYLGNHSKLTNEKCSYNPCGRKDRWITFIYNGWNSLMNHKLEIENNISYVMIFICFYLTLNDFSIFFQYLCAQVFLLVLEHVLSHWFSLVVIFLLLLCCARSNVLCYPISLQCFKMYHGNLNS